MENLKITIRQCMEIAILLAMACLIAAYFYQQWMWVGIALGLLLSSILVPVIFHPLAFLWFGLARLLGFLSSHILLTLIFFLLVSPVGLFRKWVGKDSLQLKDFKKSKQSVLKIRNYQYLADDLKYPF